MSDIKTCTDCGKSTRSPTKTVCKDCEETRRAKNRAEQRAHEVSQARKTRAERAHAKTALQERAQAFVATAAMAGPLCCNASDAALRVRDDPEQVASMFGPTFYFGPSPHDYAARVSLATTFRSETAEPFFFSTVQLSARVETAIHSGGVANMLAKLTFVEAAVRFAAILECAVGGQFDHSVNGYAPDAVEVRHE